MRVLTVRVLGAFPNPVVAAGVASVFRETKLDQEDCRVLIGRDTPEMPDTNPPDLVPYGAGTGIV